MMPKEENKLNLSQLKRATIYWVVFGLPPLRSPPASRPRPRRAREVKTESQHNHRNEFCFPTILPRPRLIGHTCTRSSRGGFSLPPTSPSPAGLTGHRTLFLQSRYSSPLCSCFLARSLSVLVSWLRSSCIPLLLVTTTSLSCGFMVG
jgi:hypothetical protein